MNLFLIAHRVRCELAFDVAELVGQGTPSDPGPWWIIPTSGHRAYPFAWASLDTLYTLEAGSLEPFLQPSRTIVPADLRDHYACNDLLPSSRNRRNHPSKETSVESIA